MTQVTARGSSGLRTDEMPRPTREQRVARGKAARAEVPRSSHAEFKPAAGRPDPVTLLESQDASRVPELLPDPVRADGRLRLHVLPRRRPAHGERPGRHPADRADRPGLRRRAPVQLRRVRLAGAEPRLRHQRLRRDPARAVGVGRQAARGEPGDRRAGQRLLHEGAAGDRAGGGVGVPARDAGVRRPHRARGLVRPRRRRPRSSPGSDRTLSAAAAQDARPQSRQGADQGQPRGARPLRRRPTAAGRRSSATRR